MTSYAELAGGVSTATLHEAAGQCGALPAAIRPIRAGMRLVGAALPVRGPSGDNLWLHRAIYAAEPGQVLICDVGGEPEYGYWGEVMAVAAQERGIAGLVINGGVRDSREMADRGFPVFSRCVTVLGTGKDPSGAGSVGEPVTVGSVTVRRGDLVVGDDDGVVVVPAERARQAVTASRTREARENDIFTRLAHGESTIEIYRLPRGDR